jgi:hypothetical protein
MVIGSPQFAMAPFFCPPISDRALEPRERSARNGTRTQEHEFRQSWV